MPELFSHVCLVLTEDNSPIEHNIMLRHTVAKPKHIDRFTIIISVKVVQIILHKSDRKLKRSSVHF